MKKSLRLIYYTFQIMLTLSAVIVLSACTTKHSEDLLTSQERQWLIKHDGKISMALETNYAPFSFVDDNGVSRGLATEYIELIEKKFNFRIKKTYFNSLNEILNSAQKKRIDIINAVTETEDRSKYLLFTKPYIKIPNIIIVRKEQKQSLTIDKMKNMKTALVTDYAITEYLTKNYIDLNILLVPDDLAALMSVSFNQTQAAVIDLATASYFISQKGITNLCIAGEANYNIKLAIASRNDLPILNRILEKGLSSITDKERKSINNKWISFGHISFFQTKEFWIIIFIIALTVLALVGIIIWNRLLTRRVEQRTLQLKEELAERKLAEEELKGLKLQLSNALDMAHLGHWEYDVVKDLFIFNDHFYKIFGTTAEHMGGYSMSSSEYAMRFVHPDDIFIVENENRKALEADSPHFNRQLEHRMIYADGTIGYISVRFFITKDINGKTVKTYGVNQDITERKKAENEIKKQKLIFETMFNTIPDSVFITNTRREIQLVNKAVESVFGYKAEELTGKSTQIFYADSNKYKNVDIEAFDKNINLLGELFITSYKDKKGRHFSGETFGAKLFDENNEWIGNLEIVRDITEREQAEMRIQQAQKMESIGNLAGGIAHDFNNILFPIIGLAEMLTEDLSPDSLEQVNAHEILKAAKRGADLVKQILAFSRQHEHKLIPVRPQQVLKEVLQLSRSTIPMNININQYLQPECGLILADSTQLHQIGMNLITNAYHAVENTGGQISVQIKEVVLDKNETSDMSIKPGKYAMLSVEDNGVGIPSANLGKIFDPYFTTKEQGKGTGLGLAVIYGIIKEHKGDIKIYSEQGKGSVFKVYLPLMSSIEQTESPIKQVASKGGTEAILLVDDELPIIRLEKQILERLGYKVNECTSSVDALEAFKVNPNAYDLVITDMSMPNMTGEQLAREMLEIRPGLPIIICTGFSEKMNFEIAEDLGIKALLIKPVVKSEMANTVRTVLDSQ